MDSGMLESSRARVAVVFVLLLVWCGLSAPQAQALCLTQPEDGTWRNSDPNTLSLTQAVLQFICQDQILNGEPHPPGPPWRVHLWGDCLPTDCDWGRWMQRFARSASEPTFARFTTMDSQHVTSTPICLSIEKDSFGSGCGRTSPTRIDPITRPRIGSQENEATFQRGPFDA